MVEVSGDVVTSGSITANNFIVGSTNVTTEINTKQDIITDGSLTIARTNGLLTALGLTAKLASFNNFTANQTIPGDLLVTGGAIANTATVLSTTPTLDGQLTSKFYVDTQDALTAKLAEENTFTANQSITGDLSVSGLITQSNIICFKAYYNLGADGATIVVNDGNNIPYNTTQYDVGSKYDGVNYKYVVPVSGL
jgi:hypothetical protein